MRGTFLVILGVMFLMVAFALASPLVKFLPGDAVTVSSHTVTEIFATNYQDRNRMIYSSTYDLAIASTTLGVSCSLNFPVKKGVYFGFPENATYSVFGLSCGADDTVVFKVKDR